MRPFGFTCFKCPVTLSFDTVEEASQAATDHKCKTELEKLLEDINKHWAWLPSDHAIDVSSRDWYQWQGGQREGQQAKLIRRIKKELTRLRDIDNE